MLGEWVRGWMGRQIWKVRGELDVVRGGEGRVGEAWGDRWVYGRFMGMLVDA